MNDVLENRQFVTIAKRPLIYQYLDKKAKEILDCFLVEISKKYYATYVRTICISVSKFLMYALAHRVDLPIGITHRLIFDYYQDDIDRSQKSKNQSNRNIKVFCKHPANP